MGRRYLLTILRWSMVIVGMAASLGQPVVECEGAEKLRLLVVSSYHRDYLWSQDTQRGLCDALRELGYLDSPEQAAEFTAHDEVESSRAMIKKLWMDTKRKSSKAEMQAATLTIAEQAKAFRPHCLLLGDDNAANYIGNYFLDSEIPIVFWGVNNTPVKYGLVDSLERPGHNVTGVYQSGYYVESLQLLKRLAPRVKTVAVISDDSETGRAHYKAIELLARQGLLPLELIEIAATGEFEVWKQKALELQGKADALFVAQYAALKDANGVHVEDKEVARWYLSHITIPESTLGFFVEHGLLCAAEDSGYNQGVETVRMAHEILANNVSPATFPPRVPGRGPLMVNVKRAKMLGIALTPEMGIEQYVEEALALSQQPIAQAR